ncbi:MAG: hypothetical protein HQM08_23665 [Candidatus Riflebacteria bacterium]|nr:hypothetical protein [Candidatus Riflebacteria bacterium]
MNQSTAKMEKRIHMIVESSIILRREHPGQRFAYVSLGARIRSMSFLREINAICITLMFLLQYPIQIFAGDASVEDRIYYSAESLWREGKINDAKKDFLRVLKLNPNHHGALFYMGTFEYQEKHLSNAQDLLEKLQNDSEFGSRARKILADIKREIEVKKALDSIKIYIEGGALNSAFEESKKSAFAYPGKPELIFYAAFTAALNGDFHSSREFLESYKMEDRQAGQELQSFIDAWEVRNDNPRETLKKINLITDARLLPQCVREGIHKLVTEKDGGDEYEKFLIAEAKRGGNTARESEIKLAKLYLGRRDFVKAAEILEKQPIENIEDNILLMEALTESDQEIRVLKIGKALYYSGSEEEREKIRLNWLKAFNRLSLRSGSPIQGEEELVITTIESLLADLKPMEKSETSLACIKAATILGNESLIHKGMEKVFQAEANENIVPELIAISEMLSAKKFTEESLALLEGVLAQRPEDPEVIKMIAKKYIVQDRLKDALALLESGVKSNPKSISTFFMYVDTLNSDGETKKAGDCLLMRLQDPDIPDLARRQIENRLNAMGDTFSSETETSNSSDVSSSSIGPSVGDSASNSSAGINITPKTSSGVISTASSSDEKFKEISVP